MPSNLELTPRSLGNSPSLHTPKIQNFQPHNSTPSLQHFQPNHTVKHNSWSLPGRNEVKATPSVPTFGHHPGSANPSPGILHNGSNPYLSTTNHTRPGTKPLGGERPAGLPGTTGHHLPSLGHAGPSKGETHVTTFKPNLGSNTPFANHPKIGEHQIGGRPSTPISGWNHNGLGKGHQHPEINKLPQFQPQHHGNHGNWGLGGPSKGGGHVGGVGPGNWNHAWRNNCVHHHHHHWYSGAWGYWGLGFYAPFYWGASYWGLNSFYSPWGYGNSYYNPYCVTLVQPADASLPVTYYTQPVALPQQPVTDDSDANLTAAYQLVDNARTDFRSGNYPAALAKLDQAIPQLPNDTVVHELRGLVLFAMGEYRPAAATLNAVLAVAPGMDWATLRGLYPNIETYESQLRKLEDTTAANRQDPALRFVLAYLYMVTNYPEAATAQLKKVVELEPQDVVAKRLLESLTKSDEAPVPLAPAPAGADAASANPATDLVGRWRGTANGSTFDLTLGEDLQFEWKVTPADGAAVKQTGRFTATTDRLILESVGQEALLAKVQSLGADRFQFWANDKQAIVFERQTSTTTAKPTTTNPPEPMLPLIPAPPPVPAAGIPAPRAPVIGADGLPLVPSPADATKPANVE